MGFLNTNSAITQQLMQTVKTLEAEWRQVLRGSVGKGTKEGESSTGCVWTAVFHHLKAHFRLACILKLMYHLFLSFSFFFSKR
jgi:hypothetical protein